MPRNKNVSDYHEEVLLENIVQDGLPCAIRCCKLSSSVRLVVTQETKKREIDIQGILRQKMVRV